MRLNVFVWVLVGLAMAWFGRSAEAGTIAYWRMEDGSGTTVTDSGGTHTGTVYGSEGSGFQWVTPGICNPVPLTGEDNDYALELLTSNGYVTVPDATDFYQPSAFTIEVMFKPTAANPSGMLVGQWGNWNSDPAKNNQQWGLFLEDSGQGYSYPVFKAASTSGYGSEGLGSLHVYQDGEYCVAAAFEVYGGGTGSVTLYGRTASGPWKTNSGSFGLSGGLHDSPAPLTMGRDADGAAPFLGVIDEVRYSSGKLSQDELLASPEPASASLALLAAGVGALVARRKRRRKPPAGAHATD